MKDNRKFVLFVSLITGGDWDKSYQIFSSRNELYYDEFNNFTFPELKCNYVTILDEEYPRYLKRIHKPPFVLYYQGDLSLINEEHVMKNIAVVGTRNMSSYGYNYTKEIVDNIPNDYCIVSGGAIGVDTTAHTEALKTKKKTICVVGGGLDINYPKANSLLFNEIRNKGLIISEYPPGVPPLSTHFPLRNRLIAAFSRGILITEGYQYSGTSITLEWGLEFGKVIMSIPYRIAEENGAVCNFAIKQGAYLIEKAEDVINAMEWL